MSVSLSQSVAVVLVVAFVVVTSSSSSFSSFFCFLSQLLLLLLLLFLSAQREIVCNFVAISSFTAAAAAAVAVAKLFLQYFLIKPGAVSQLVSSVSWTTALLCCSFLFAAVALGCAMCPVESSLSLRLSCL